MTRAFFNERADTWDKKNAEKDASKLEQMAKRLQIKPGDTILDVGTGTGIFLPYLLEKAGTDGEIIALDIAEKMLLKARAKDLKSNICFLCADAMSIPLQNGVCDGIVCYSSFPHLPDKPGALTEMRRILKKGGWIFICHTSSREQINKIHRQVPVLENDMLPDAIEMMQMLSHAGFTEIQVEDKADSYLACGCKPN